MIMNILEENKLLVRCYYEEVVNTGNVENIAQYVASDFTEDYYNNKHQVGIAGAKEHIRGVRTTFPDLVITINRQIAEGDWVVTQITARGTHQGSWLGMAPTGKKVEITGVNVDKVVNGRIVEHGGAANMLESLLRIGAIKVV